MQLSWREISLLGRRKTTSIVLHALAKDRQTDNRSLVVVGANFRVEDKSLSQPPNEYARERCVGPLRATRGLSHSARLLDSESGRIFRSSSRRPKWGNISLEVLNHEFGDED